MQKACHGTPCIKIDKDHYCDTRTGEYFEYKHIENRSQSLQSIRHTLSMIRALINTNCVVPENIRWVTLTYKENMTDTKRLMKDYEHFWKRFLRWCAKQGYDKPEYITVQEPQGRGAWHIHAFFIWQSKAPFIPNNEVLEKLWGQGFTKCKAVSDCDNIGAYFSAYLADMPVEDVEQLPAQEKEMCLSGSFKVEQKKFVADDGKEKDKRFIKGGRLYLYPAGMNIVRRTKGIKDPIVETMPLFEAQKKVPAGTETFSRAYAILADNGTCVNVIRKSYYNSNRSKK